MKKYLKYSLAFLFIPILLLFKILSPIVRIRWAKKYFPDRIGHLVAEMEHYLCLIKKNKKFTIDLFPKNIFFNSNPSNTFLQKHYATKITKINTIIIKLFQLSQEILEKFFNFTKFDNIDALFSTRDNKKIFNKGFKPTISFSESDMIFIKKKLKKIGIKQNQKFVCLIIRDGKYLKKKLPKINFSYHDYRDSNTDNYKLGIKYLIKKNYFVLRMGKLQSRKLNLQNNKFLDYAFSKHRSDLMDVWLMANCEFCISTSTGLDQISRVFNKPTLLVNHLPLTEWSSHFRSLTHPKFLYSIKKKKFLDLEEYIVHSYFRKKYYEENYLKIIDLDRKQILSCIKEFLQLINNNWKISKQKKKKQLNFNSLFKKYLKEYHPNIDFHKNIHKHALISLNFLKKTKLLSKKKIKL